MNKIFILKITCILFSYFFVISPFNAQSLESYAQFITTTSLKQHLSILASDSLEGRETATEGSFKAAQYIIQELKSSGVSSGNVDGSFLQPINFTNSKWDSTSMLLNNNSYRHLRDFYAYPTYFKEPLLINTDSIIFAGYGIEFGAYSDYGSKDVSGKVVLILDGEPMLDDSIPILRSREVSNLDYKLNIAKEKNVALLIVVDRNFSSNIFNARRIINGNALELPLSEKLHIIPTLFLNPTVLKQSISDASDDFFQHRLFANFGTPKPPISLPLSLHFLAKSTISVFKGANIIAKIEGSDPVLKNEYVFISAHYDHLGKRGNDIFHGADDDGSGTTSLLQIMKSFGEAQKKGINPKRTIIGLWVTGEEKGLLGSSYYVENPLYPIEKTVTDLNIDMVGRIDLAHESNPNYVYIIGSDMLSKDLHQINESINKKYTNLVLDYKYNSKDDPNRFYYRSDHYNFAKFNIPIIFYFNGTHPDYHRITDTVDKINFEVMSKRAKLVYYNAYFIANRDKRPVLD